MHSTETPKPSIGNAEAIRRRAVKLSSSNLVSVGQSEKPLPLLVRPAAEQLNLTEWAVSNREFVETNLSGCGAILFRGFNVRTADEFETFVKTLFIDLLDYSYGSTPRRRVGRHIYTSTEYPAEQSIPLHNEMSYSRSWPMRIAFFCQQAAAVGGQTPIADSRRVFASISPRVREQFARRKVMYVRNYGAGFDLHWHQVFQTTDRAEVEAFCRRAGIEFEWMGGDGLRTSQVCQAIAAHPTTGEAVWFNQAHLFHVSNLAAETRDALSREFGEEALPRNAYYGDGSAIEPSALEEVREAYRRESVVFDWEEGDVLLLDNMLAAHGRRPFSGPRKVLVGMTGLFSNSSL